MGVFVAFATMFEFYKLRQTIEQLKNVKYKVKDVPLKVLCL